MVRNKAKNRKLLELIFLGGLCFLMGFLFSIGIKYPFLPEEIKRAEIICGPGVPVKKVTIGVSGKIYKVTCDNSAVYDLHN